ncbi:hypothetical protein ACQEU5_14355 [Marinactinospora thermotolerans]|uniref:MFS transporter, MHS family, proline/betaine transporter n=1 Tax=Marinactinospora thermotolerans DSM 45154 TaxID=1122192 RepID=A0A1T4RSX4_9ACTN|nr:hypothetical protein [Marinactinospora thermotolerans]SKA18966.1 MFS transporter, MHS family, proline/betaine transporter [Marinactinospora thermotolerans DSM 45154]
MLASPALCPFAARAGDRFGRRPMPLAACGGFVVLTAAAFHLMGTGLAGALVRTSTLAMLVAVIGTSHVPAMVEMFPAQLRAGGSALGYTTAYVLFGGTAPSVATWPVIASGSAVAPAYYLVGAAVIGVLVAALLFKETRSLSLTRTTVR